MFLRKDNTIKWKEIGIAATITVALCVAGALWFDKPMFMFMREFDWHVWGLLDQLFATKVWLFVSAVAAVLIAGRIAAINKERRFQLILKNFIAEFKARAKSNPGFLVFASVLCASIVGGILKYGLGRARPIFYEALGHTGFYPFTPEWAFNSMPSGHATASFAGLVMIGMLFPKIKWATWTGAIIIALSRVCYGAHWPSDVILGAFIGMVTADLVKSWFYKK